MYEKKILNKSLSEFLFEMLNKHCPVLFEVIERNVLKLKTNYITFLVENFYFKYIKVYF